MVNDPSLISMFHEMVFRFNVDIIGLPIPAQPSLLSPVRKTWAETALAEELNEFIDAETREDEVDAMLDLAYFALGRVVEMGYVPGPAFEEVHQRNMAKKRGELSKRPGSLGYDAVKPNGWTAPDIVRFSQVTTEDVETIEALRRGVVKLYYNPVTAQAIQASRGGDVMTAKSLDDLFEDEAPKVLVIGHARHGKDTVAEILAEDYGMEFISSSLFCAETVVWPALLDPREACAKHYEAGAPGLSSEKLAEQLLEMVDVGYSSAAAAYEDRNNFRDVWFSLIAAYCYPNKAALGEQIFKSNDVYVGVRNRQELTAIVNSGLSDLVIWVDASLRLPAESEASCTVEPYMADYIIDNNGSRQDLQSNVHTLMQTLGFARKGL